MRIGAHIIAIICISLRILQYNMRIGAHIIAIICALLHILQYNMCISVHIIVILVLMIFFKVSSRSEQKRHKDEEYAENVTDEEEEQEDE